MISLSIEKIIGYWIKNEIINEEDADIYEFGLDLLLFSMINFLIISITAVYMGRLIESILLFVTMIPLQSVGGGYHANTHMRCFLIMYIGWWVIMRAVSFINGAGAVLICLSSVAVIFFLAPIPNINVHVSELRRRKLKRMIRMMSVIIGGVCLLTQSVMLNSDFSLSALLAMGMGGIAFSMVMACFKNRRFLKGSEQ